MNSTDIYNSHLENTYRKLDKYFVIETIGKGIHKVKLVYDPKTKKNFAAKICKKSFKKLGLSREALYLEKLSQHSLSHTLKFIEFIEKDQNKKPSQISCQDRWAFTEEYDFQNAIILELAPNGTLFDLILNSSPLEEKIVRTIFTQLVTCVKDLHENGYVHRDLKPENILLDENYQLKIGDFGLCEQFDKMKGDEMSSKVGTENYMPPEFYSCQSYKGTKVDIFALGIILFLLNVGSPPFFKATPNDSFYKYFTQRKTESFWLAFEKKLRKQNGFNEDLKLLVEDLLSSSPENRPKAQDILNYKWMTEEIYSEIALKNELERIMMNNKKIKSL